MTFDERKEKIIQFVKTYGQITNSDAQALCNIHRNTATGDLKRLVEEKILIAFGTNKSASYKLLENLIFAPTDISALFPKKDHTILEKHFKTQNRKKVFFNKISPKALALDLSFPKNINESFESLKNKIEESKPAINPILDFRAAALL